MKLIDYSKNIYSQCGEDGIIEQIFQTIKIRNNWCVEFGAWDAKYMSNTFNLIKNKGYAAILIEANRKKMQVLNENIKEFKNVKAINAYVGWDGNNKLDNILKDTEIPYDFDLLSIDVDGNDYHIWNSFKNYQPKIVIIEHNPTFPNHIEFIQRPNIKCTHGSSLNSLCILAKTKSYELLAVTDTNAIFIDSKYYKLFDITDNSLEQLNHNRKYLSYISQGYDGTLFFNGCNKFLWHGIPINKSKIQQIPMFFREYPNNFGVFKNYFFKYYSLICRKMFDKVQ